MDGQGKKDWKTVSERGKEVKKNTKPTPQG